MADLAYQIRDLAQAANEMTQAASTLRKDGKHSASRRAQSAADDLIDANVILCEKLLRQVKEFSEREE